MTIPFPLRLTISEGPFPADSLSIRRPGLELLLWKGWLCDGDCQLLRRHLLSAAIPWQQPRLRVYGREHPVPRLVCWFGDPGCSYRYSQHVHDPLPWTPPLARLRERLNDQLGNDYNSLLLNRYRHGADRMGWHADDEPELDAIHPIASLSLGVSRSLRFRPRPPGRRRIDGLAADQPPLSVELGQGDLLLMLPPTQRHWQHGLPARLREPGERINLTFRRIRPWAVSAGAGPGGRG